MFPSKTPRRTWLLWPRQIRQLMTTVALGGLVAWTAAPRGGGPLGPARPFARPPWAPRQAQARNAPLVVVPFAGQDIDPGFVHQAPAGIDDRFVVAAPRRDRRRDDRHPGPPVPHPRAGAGAGAGADPARLAGRPGAAMTWSPEAVGEAWVRAVALWNVAGLPALLIAAAAATLTRRRADWADRRRVVRQLGLMHYGLAAWSLTTVVDEFWASRAQGFAGTNVVAVVPALVSVLVDPPLGFGLRRFRRAARWAAVAFGTLRWTLVVWLTAIGRQFGASLDWTEWPRLAAGRALPAFVLVALLLPATGRAFAARGDEPAPGPEPGPVDRAVALASRLFLVVLGSAVATDALDWAVRAAGEVAAGGT